MSFVGELARPYLLQSRLGHSSSGAGLGSCSLLRVPLLLGVLSELARPQMILPALRRQDRSFGEIPRSLTRLFGKLAIQASG